LAAIIATKGAPYPQRLKIYRAITYCKMPSMWLLRIALSELSAMNVPFLSRSLVVGVFI